jgi:phytoene dehydrogenase-like protein
LNVKTPVSGAARQSSLASRQVYDVVVVGTRVGGALAGALLAKRGHRVLHLATDGWFGRYQDGEFVLPFEPSLSPAVKAVPALHGALEELGLLTDVTRTIEPYPEGMQVLLPRARLQLFREEPPRTDELKREFADAAPALVDAFARQETLEEEAGRVVMARPLPADGLFENWALSRAAREAGGLLSGELPFGEGHPLGAALLGLRVFASFLDAAQSPLAFARTVAPLLRAPHRYPGGKEALVELLRASIRSHGGDVLGTTGKPVAVEEILVDKGRFAGVKVAGAPTPYRARACIATDAAAAAALIPESRRRRKFETLTGAVRPRRAVVTANLVLAEEGVPPGMADLALAVAAGKEPSPLLVQIDPADNGHGPVPGLWTVTLAGAFPVAAVADRPGIERAVAALRDAAEEYLPFHDRHLKKLSVPALVAGGGAMPPHLLVESDLPRRLGVEGLPPVAPIKRLLFAGPEVLPGLGFEGEVLAGTRAAELAGELCRKVDPLL